MKHYPLLLAGEERETMNKIEVINPYNHKPIATVSYGNESDLKEAIDKASLIFPVTRGLASYKRSEICLSIVDQIKDNSEDMAETIAAENGKPLIYARGEVARCMDTFTIAAEEAKRITGEFSSLDSVKRGVNRFSITNYFPKGLVAGICPFNFPLNLVAHKIAPAIAVGAPIILKPASTTPISALKLGIALTIVPLRGTTLLRPGATLSIIK